MTESGGFYKYRCKYFYKYNCNNWVWVNQAACAVCMAEGRDDNSGVDWTSRSSRGGGSSSNDKNNNSGSGSGSGSGGNSGSNTTQNTTQQDKTSSAAEKESKS